MKIPSLVWSLNLGILLNFVTCQVTQAQVTSDNTVNTQVTQNGNVSEITGGQTEGSNLFHSFQDFSVPTGNEASFLNANDISNIFSRVTGGNISNIDGAIRANDANLFLINPAGIMFGAGARLSLGGGSFYGSTADSILFPDGVEFSASDTQAQPILTINAPIGLGFRDNPKDVEVTGATLEVDSGQDLTFVGGNINLDGASLIAPGGRVELGGLSVAGEVGLSDDGSFAFAENIGRADISLTNNAEVDVRAEGGGFINVNARNLTLSEQSEILAGISEDSNSPEAQAGDITINATGSVELIGEGFSFISGVFNSEEEVIARETSTSIRNNIGFPAVKRSDPNTRSNALGNAGSIFINAKNLEISNFALVDTGIYGNGIGGNIVVNTEQVSLNTGSLRTDLRSVNLENLIEQGNGEAGNISIFTNSLSLSNDGSLIFTGLQQNTAGNGGGIEINAVDSISISGGETRSSSLLTQIGENATGNAGNIILRTSSLELDNRGILLSAIRAGSMGNAGNIFIDAAETLSLTGNSQILAQIGENATGDAGNISITAGSFNLDKNSQVITDTRGRGDAGDIEISTGSFEILENSLIQASTKGQGNAGDVKINVEDNFIVENNSFILSQVEENGVGNAGNIEISTGSFELKNASFILANTNGLGNAGNITAISRNNISLSKRGIISNDVSDRGEGIAGNINLSANDIILDANSIIASSTFGQGNAGDININANLLSLENFSLIAAVSTENGIGDAGIVNINANNVVILDGGIISSFTTNNFNGGEVNINAQTLELIDGGNVYTGTDSTGNAGDINLNITDIIILDGNNSPDRPSEFDFLDQILNDLEGRTGILADATNQSTGNGGNITIDTNFIIAFPNGNSDIVANASDGNGGNINVDAQAIFGIRERPLNSLTNDIDASSQFNLNGNVSINTPDNNIVQSDRDLPSNPISDQKAVSQACSRDRSIASINSFTISGKGGIPPLATEPMDSGNIIINGEITNNAPVIPEPIQTSQGKIQPARGIRVTESGKIILTAYRTNNSGERIPETKHNCG